jgi:tetrahydromethanopterin S-methyltransferase subunit G
MYKNKEEFKNLSGGEIAGIVIGVIIGLILLAIFLLISSRRIKYSRMFS